MAEGTCVHCGAAFTESPLHRGRHRYCSRRCRIAARTAWDAAVAEWRLCGTCGRLYPVSNQTARKRAGVRSHACDVAPTKLRMPICLTCLVVKESGHVASKLHNRIRFRSNWNPVPLHDITCIQCGSVFTGKWTSKCPDCVQANFREQRKQGKRKRRARLASVPSERYRTQDIYQRDGWRCHLCGRLTSKVHGVPHPKAPTIGHLVPVSEGGADSPANVATAHFECNWRRGAGGVAQLRLIA